MCVYVCSCIMCVCVCVCSVLGDCWRQIVIHPQQESLHRSKTLTSIEEEVIQPLSVFLLSDLEKRFHQVSAFIPAVTFHTSLLHVKL